MTRKQYHDMREIIREQLGQTCHIAFNDMISVYEGMTGFRCDRHDEGYSATTVEVFPDDHLADYYIMNVYNDSRDCDGKMSYSQSFLMRANTGKRKRWYWLKDTETGRPKGKFGVRNRWQAVKKFHDRQRDYTAESMGY